MGLKIQIPGVTFDTPTLVQIDPILEGHDGGLVLFEPGHPYLADLTTVPVNAAAVTNLAFETCTAMTGGAGNGVWAISDITAGKGMIERSDKGGVQYVTSRTLGTTSMFGRVDLPTAIKAYLIGTGDSHHFYLSTWARKTRLEISNANSVVHAITSVTSAGSNYMTYQTEASGSGAGSGGAISALARSLGAQRGSVHGTGWAGTKPGAAASVHAVALASGGTVLAGNALNMANWVMYRTYFEDLTVSGRTYTEVDALDLALYTKEVLTTGGRYHSDDWTNPATVT